MTKPTSCLGTLGVQSVHRAIRGMDRVPTSLLPQSSTSRQGLDSAQNSPSHLPGIPPRGMLRTDWGAGPPSNSGPSRATGTLRLSATASEQKHSCLPSYSLHASSGPHSYPDSGSPVMPSTACAHQEQEGALWPGRTAFGWSIEDGNAGGTPGHMPRNVLRAVLRDSTGLHGEGPGCRALRVAAWRKSPPAPGIWEHGAVSTLTSPSSPHVHLCHTQTHCLSPRCCDKGHTQTHIHHSSGHRED